MAWGWLFMLFHTNLYAQTVTRFTVSGHSMQPTLQPGDQVEINSSCVEKNNIVLNDVVGIKFKNLNIPVIKRVVATPGTTFEVTAQNNNKLLAKQLTKYQNVLPQNQFIVTGDNTTVSQDSNSYGMIAKHQIIGCMTQVLKP